VQGHLERARLVTLVGPDGIGGLSLLDRRQPARAGRIPRLVHRRGLSANVPAVAHLVSNRG
jgi:ribose 1,5-bisphosphokinase PhnN